MVAHRRGLPPVAVGDLTPDRLRDAAYRLAPDCLRDAAYRLAPWLDALVDAWEDYLRVGGFPQAIASHIRHRQPDASLQRALFGVISGDAFQRARLSDPQTTEMLRRLTRGLGSPLNSSRLARGVSVSLPTAQRRIDDLRESFVVWPAYREDGLRPNLRAQGKVYFTDPVYVPVGYRDARAIDETTLSEQQLGMALLRSSLRDGHSSYPDFDRVLYYRSATGTEIDFVGPDFRGVAIESKYCDGRWRRSAGRTLAASPWRGVVATRTELDLEEPEMAAAPTAMLAWLIDA